MAGEVWAGEIWRAWLAATVLWEGLTTGAIAIAMMTRLIPGTWRESLAGPLQLMPRVWLVAALAMLPVFFLPGLFYGWVAHPEGGGFRHVWLNPVFFALRGVAWMALLGFLARRLTDGGKHVVTSAVGLMILVPVAGVMAIDWLMSLDASFASSGFGLYVLSVEMLLAFALATAAASRTDLSERALDVLGGVLLVILILWAYLGFMQYFIIWSGDLPDGVAWYLRRGGGWAPLAWIAITMKLIAGSLLIFSHVRRNPKALAAVSLMTALAAVPEIGWVVLPAPGLETGAGGLILFLLMVSALSGLTFGLARRRRRAAA